MATAEKIEIAQEMRRRRAAAAAASAAARRSLAN